MLTANKYMIKFDARDDYFQNHFHEMGISNTLSDLWVFFNFRLVGCCFDFCFTKTMGRSIFISFNFNYIFSRIGI